MWSRKSSPVATLTRPNPSRSSLARSRVSLLSRVTSAFLLKAHLDRVRVGSQSFHRRQPHTSPAEQLQVPPIQAQEAGALHEGVHAERRPEPGRAGGWKRMVG